MGTTRDICTADFVTNKRYFEQTLLDGQLGRQPLRHNARCLPYPLVCNSGGKDGAPEARDGGRAGTGKGYCRQRAKSSLASFIAGIGRVGLVLIKAFVVLLLFPLFALCLMLIFITVAGVSGLGAELLQFGNLGSFADFASNFGSAMPILTLFAVLVPIVTIIYLFTTLVIGRRPRWWVLLCAFIVWIALLIGIFSSAVRVITNGNIDEVERIMKQDWDEHSLDEPLDSLQYQQLINDPNATEI